MTGVQTCALPIFVEYVIPANDDASKSIDKVLSYVTAAVIEGLANRTSDKETDAPTEEVVAEVEAVDTKAEEAAVVAEAKSAE